MDIITNIHNEKEPFIFEWFLLYGFIMIMLIKYLLISKFIIISDLSNNSILLIIDSKLLCQFKFGNCNSSIFY